MSYILQYIKLILIYLVDQKFDLSYKFAAFRLLVKICSDRTKKLNLFTIN